MRKLTKIFAGAVILLLPSLSVSAQVQVCTAEAGQLISPNGICIGYTNGCERADLISQGYSVIQPGQSCRTPDIIPNNLDLPPINNVTVYVAGICSNPLPGTVCPAVEPWTMVEFTHSSCAERTFEVVVDTTLLKSNPPIEVNEIAIVDKSPIDCFGAMISRTYKLQIDDNANATSRYFFLNPISAFEF